MEKIFKNLNFKDILIVSAFALISNILIWLPHFFQLQNFYFLNFSEGFNTIYRNYDGINYIIIAKTFYHPQLISLLPQSLPANYYAAHFPLFPLLILAFSTTFGFLKSMLFVSTLFTIFSTIMFYLLVKHFKLSEYPVILSLIFLVLPARWLIVHSVGSAEPVFIFFVLATIYFLMKYEIKQSFSFILISAILAFFAQLTRPPGALLAISIAAFILYKIFTKKIDLLTAIKSYYPFLLISIALFMIFGWYSIAYQDFFAYFHSGDNIHLTFPPYQVFNNSQYWVGDIWLEDIIYIFLIGFSAVVLLFKQKLFLPAFFTATYLIASIFVAHRDISRYTLPLFPFALIAFEKYLTSKEFRIVLVIVLLAIYLYSQNYILNNTAPFPNLEYFN